MDELAPSPEVFEVAVHVNLDKTDNAPADIHDQPVVLIALLLDLVFTHLDFTVILHTDRELISVLMMGTQLVFIRIVSDN